MGEIGRERERGVWVIGFGFESFKNLAKSQMRQKSHLSAEASLKLTKASAEALLLCAETHPKIWLSTQTAEKNAPSAEASLKLAKASAEACFAPPNLIRTPISPVFISMVSFFRALSI